MTKFRREYRRQADTQACRRRHVQSPGIRGIRCVDWDALRLFQEAGCWIAHQARSRPAEHLYPASVSRSSTLDIFEQDSPQNYAAHRMNDLPRGLM
jgi:hypothetical protein